MSDTAARLWSLASLATPMAIRVAATLGLADEIKRGVTSIDELAQKTNTAPDALLRLVHHLPVQRIFEELPGGQVGITELARPLLNDHPWRSRAWFDIDGAASRADLSFTELLHCVRSGSSAYEKRFSCGFWQDLAADNRLSASFDALMSTQLVGRASEIVNAIDWTNTSHVVDVGGGDGTLLETILLSHPQIHGTLVDLPGPIASARKRFSSAPLATRIKLVPTSFFDSLPEHADLYLVCGVLSDWPDEQAIALLRQCAAAAGPRGRIVVVGGPYQQDNPEEATEMDLRMLLYFGGRERNRDEIIAIAARSGLTVRSIATAGERSVVELLQPPESRG